MYLDNFKKTPLVFMSDDHTTLEYVLGKGKEFPKVGIRRDGVGGYWHYQNWIGSKKYSRIPQMGDIWKTRPVLLEFIANAAKQKEWSMKRAVDFVISNHACLFNENWQLSQMNDEEKAEFRRLAKDIGARICPRHSRAELSGSNLAVSLDLLNFGNCPIYLPYELVYELRNPDGKVAATFVSKADPAKWLPGEISLSDEFALPKNLQKGKYELVARLAHKYKIFRDFKFAAKESNPDGSVTLAEISL